MRNAAQILQEIAQEKIKLIEKFEKETGTRFHGLANFNSCYEKAREYFEQQLINKEGIMNSGVETGANCNQPTLNKMTDLQKQIEELRNDFSEMENLTHEGEEFDLGELWKVAREALSIVKQLQEENNAYISCLRRINSCDDSATQQSREAHQVLKQFGKL